MIRIRVDDFPHTKGEPQHSIENFRKFERVIRDIVGVNFLLGVIPNRLEGEHIRYLRDESSAVIGMHGVSHDENSLNIHQNEFPPVIFSDDAVLDILRDTRGMLAVQVGSPVDVYMPPRNIIDQRTIDAARQAGFSAFTGGPETDLNLIRENPDIILSRVPHEYGRSDEMLKRMSHVHLVNIGQSETVTLTFHWTWEVNIGLNHLVTFLRNIPSGLFMDFTV